MRGEFTGLSRRLTEDNRLSRATKSVGLVMNGSFEKSVDCLA